MYGSRLAAYKLYIENFDHTHVNDFEWFKEFWEQIKIDTDQGKYLDDKSHKVLVDLKIKLGLPLVELTDEQSIWFKHVHFSPSKNVGWPQLLNLSALPLYGFKLPNW
jgi:DNA-binding MltR family transcriptional regulator